MAVKYLENDDVVTIVPRKQQFDLLRERLTDEEFDRAVDYINTKIDADRIHTAGWMPGADWTGTPLFPIYSKGARHNFDLAAMMFGVLVFYVFMQRPETWITGRFEKDGEPIGSRTYFIDGR